MKYLRGFIICICLIVMLVSAWQMYTIQSAYHESGSTYKRLEAYSVMRPMDKDAVPHAEEDPDNGEEIWYAHFPEVDFDALAEINADVIGWICIEDTKINYPIVQTVNDDYYLKHLFDHTPNNSGAIFMDARNQKDFSDANSFVFGHNIKNGTMFAPLFNFKKQEFYEEHPTWLLMTPEQNYVVEIFAGSLVGNKDNIWDTNFEDWHARQDWLDLMMEKSILTTDVQVRTSDRVVVLSTCSYEFNAARFFLLGILHKAEAI